ncbi:STAS domain-containing protein [Sphingomonas sp. BK580]|uniref:STAS domain-containing protein n=1 Tax=Sphingomonas sp. BK580 TaxID=2586972 RepID=UPI00160C8B04|nr:STAS domain-containing protein [Sphingomonas sp. BK580]MBB3692319.1 chemotaxis protein CheX [Sphingomonas sp. BK580]
MAYVLPPRLDTAAAPPLRVALKKLVEQAQPLAIDGSAVEQIGQACLQVLIAARTAAAAQGQPFALTAVSIPFADAAALAAVDLSAA